MNQFYNVVPNFGILPYSSVTSTTQGTATTIVTLTRDTRTILVSNSLNAEVNLTLSGVAFAYLPANVSMTIDLGSNNHSFANGATVGVYHLGVAPTTSGNIAVTAL